MTRSPILRALCLAALLALPAATAAQTEDGAQPEDGDRAGADPQTGDGADLPLGEPVDELGETFVDATHGDWEIRCLRLPEGETAPCTLYQLLRDDRDNPVAEINVFALSGGGQAAAGATIITPLSTLLTAGLRLRVDEGIWREYPFAFCQEIGCFVRLGFTEEDVAAFRAGGTAHIAIVPLQTPDQAIQLDASLVGFTAGFEALAAREAAR